jgi:predicted ATPase
MQVDGLLISSDEQADGEPRFTMLQTIREYASERLEAAGESQGVRRHHAAFFLGLAERAEQALNGPQQRAWLDILQQEHGNLLQQEHGNLRAALDWSAGAAEPLDVETGLRIAGALWFFWDKRGHAREGQERLRPVAC